MPVRIVDVRETVPPADIRNALALPDDGVAVLRSQLVLIDDEPAELVKSYYVLDIAHGTPLKDHRRIRAERPPCSGNWATRPITVWAAYRPESPHRSSSRSCACPAACLCCARCGLSTRPTDVRSRRLPW